MMRKGVQIAHPLTLETNHINRGEREGNNSSKIHTQRDWIEVCRFVRTFLQKLVHSHLVNLNPTPKDSHRAHHYLFFEGNKKKPKQTKHPFI